MNLKTCEECGAFFVLTRYTGGKKYCTKECQVASYRMGVKTS